MPLFFQFLNQKKNFQKTPFFNNFFPKKVPLFLGFLTKIFFGPQKTPFFQLFFPKPQKIQFLGVFSQKFFPQKSTFFPTFFPKTQNFHPRTKVSIPEQLSIAFTRGPRTRIALKFFRRVARAQRARKENSWAVLSGESALRMLQFFKN